MKSFTVTYHHTCNYGATLQAYALQHFLLNNGIDNQIMEYADAPQNKSKKKKSLTAIIKQLLIGILSLFRKKKHKALKAAFKRFHSEHMTLSRVYTNMDDLRKDPPDADILISGSDQVWNLRTNPAMIPSRFLDFGRKDALRITYAASIGNLNYSDGDKNRVTEYLKSFDAISVREKGAAEYIYDFSGRECSVVADPVFLLDRKEWDSIAKPRKVCDGPYILCYFVQGNPRLNEVLRKLKAETGYKVISVNCDKIARVKADHQLFDVSPEEFLGLYSGASCVVTTSFHGTAFALIYDKPLYSLIRETKDSRISDLLTEVGAADRIVRAGNSLPKYKKNEERTRLLLEAYRGRSAEYLRKAMSIHELDN